MNPMYIAYTKQLAVVGEKTQKTADVFGELGKNNSTNINDYVKANEGYKICKKDLISINPPSIVGSEHEDLVNAYQLLIDSVETMISSIDNNIGLRNEEIFQKGIDLRNSAILKAEKTADEIVSKLLKS